MTASTPQPDHTALPLTLDEVVRTMEDQRYGVPIGALGEDSDQGYACITADRRRAIAAACARWRGDGNGHAYKLEIDGPLWVQFFDRCGCPPHKPDPESGHDDCECAIDGLPPCREDTYAWIYATSKPDAVNAVCLFQIEVID